MKRAHHSLIVAVVEDREESSKSKWRYPGEKKVTFASKLPKLYSETPIEEWLQGDMLVRLIMCPAILSPVCLVPNTVDFKEPTALLEKSREC